jgi:hypothetical protein
VDKSELKGHLHQNMHLTISEWRRNWIVDCMCRAKDDDGRVSL